MSEDSAKLYRASAQEFKKIPRGNLAYWISNQELSSFDNGKALKDIAIPRVGIITGNNLKFIRYWWEILFNDISFDTLSFEKSSESQIKWYPYNKGGISRAWYGNRELVVFFRRGGEDIIKNGEETKCFYFLGAKDVFFHAGITWNGLGNNKGTFRFSPEGALFDSNKGPMLFPQDTETSYYLLALFNTKVTTEFLNILNPSISLQAGDFEKFPVLFDNCRKKHICVISQENVSLAKQDYESFETSWDFQTHPFLTYKGITLEKSYNNWEKFASSQFTQLKANEEELNKIFIEIYGLQDELTPEVKDEDVSIRKADLARDVKSFISYAVGCMLGRYSIDKPGLILANAGETAADYQAKVPDSRFEIDDDNIIPVLDDDYFHDDIVSRFREFLKIVYGKDTLELNMSFIAHALSPSSKATPDKVLRDYFLKDFYADHLKVYQKRPIYWMFTSGKQQGFNALIYMHRYNKDTLGKIWGDYLRELEAKLDAEIVLLENADKKNTTQLAKLKKQRLELKEYDADLDIAVSKKIEIDLDDGVAINYAKFGKLVRPLK